MFGREEGKMAVKITLKSIDKNLESIITKSETTMKDVVSSVRSSGPGWVASEVINVYNIQKREITPSQKDPGRKLAGKVKVRGNTIETLALVYTGRLLTPMHFDISHTEPKQGAYTLKATFFKGKRKTLGSIKKLTKKQRKNLSKNFRSEGVQRSNKSPIMLMPTGTSNIDKTAYIPFQRKTKERDSIEPIKTLSVPQMISNPKVWNNINKVLAENINKMVNKKLNTFIK